ncbi:hypothetical protein [Ralstonia pseudosolanacearum]|uniref:hypothetical protein n=1 Tax=Ralstonia pseudosolanacearum TaxID=1310165 RepID=UPI0008D9C598|nr:hypothetical protein [Ralstonia pseudosolanacearum]AZU56450.1 hypothetical protein CFM90_09630 [Ralstonia solanacearum]MCK4140535.1 hypothetical protein [Ralstonia pseudosolanacearum]OHV00674.1 hypothetical protein BLA34_11900 [Ralstonia solanacearum]QVX37941.1 hypothetical protein J4H89_13250 [Ralstonia solanacearum]RAA04693.1 hypothetical protein DOT66_24465 [Ralstonia pseudosolanacearum]
MAAKSQVDKYLEALARLKARGEPINNDAVAKEAGSGKGSIKKSRPGYATLIAAIERAAQEQKQVKASADPIPRLRQQLATLQQRLDRALEREVCLLDEVYNLREENRLLKQGRPTLVRNKTS